MTRRQQSGEHRDVHIPWRIAAVCWLWGHMWERLSAAHVHCLRCDRNARTPMEL